MGKVVRLPGLPDPAVLRAKIRSAARGMPAATLRALADAIEAGEIWVGNFRHSVRKDGRGVVSFGYDDPDNGDRK